MIMNDVNFVRSGVLGSGPVCGFGEFKYVVLSL